MRNMNGTPNPPAVDAMKSAQQFTREVQTRQAPTPLSPRDAHLLGDIASGTRTPHARQAAEDFTRGIRDERERREREMRERDEADFDPEEQAAEDRDAADRLARFSAFVESPALVVGLALAAGLVIAAVMLAVYAVTH